MALDVSIKKRCGNFILDIKFFSDNKILGVLGASGCGKSMTLKCIAGIETPDEGKIILNGRVLFDSEKKINLSPQKRNVGYLFQNYALFPHMTVKQNIAIGIRAKDNVTKIEQYLEMFQLKSLENLYPKNLSGGQQQRVALARIFASEPEILMLDEPFSALDDFLKWQLELELSKTLKAYNKDILFVSHNRDEIYRFCDDIVVLAEGCIVSQSTKHDLFKSPKTIEASKLSGCKNHAKIEHMSSNSIFAKDWNLHLDVENKNLSNYSYVGIRAHDLELAQGLEQNVDKFKIEAIIENVFSIVLMIRKEGAILPIRMELDKYLWSANRKEVDEILVKLPKEKLFLLK